jgi:hypothetical protein
VSRAPTTTPTDASLPARPPVASRRGRAVGIALLLTLLWAPPATAGLPEAQEQAARLAWFFGQSRLLLEPGRRDPTPEIGRQLEERLDRLLPPGLLAAARQTPEQARERRLAAQELDTTAGSRRELQAAAARRSLPPRLRAAAACALALLEDPLAPAALAMALPDQEDPAVQQLLHGELLDALQRMPPPPELTPLDAQLLALCRRVAALVACEPGPAWEELERLAARLRELEAGGQREEAARLLETTALPLSCPDRLAGVLIGLVGEQSTVRRQRWVLQQLELRLGDALLRDEPSLAAATRERLRELLGGVLAGTTDGRTLAAAINLTGMLGFGELLPALDALAPQDRSASLRQLLDQTTAQLRAATTGPR